MSETKLIKAAIDRLALSENVLATWDAISAGMTPSEALRLIENEIAKLEKWRGDDPERVNPLLAGFDLLRKELRRQVN